MSLKFNQHNQNCCITEVSEQVNRLQLQLLTYYSKTAGLLD